MQKPKLSNIELVFVIIAASTLVTLTFYQMSTAGILPGNDPAVHLGKSATIVINRRVTYSTVPWYPPLFHTILAMLQILIGTIDVIAAAFILKMLIATLNVLMLLSTYLLCRKLFGTGPAVAACSVVPSQPACARWSCRSCFRSKRDSFAQPRSLFAGPWALHESLPLCHS